MKSITPNTRVRPAATRNRRTPSCSPLKHCTTNSEVDMGCPGCHPLGVIPGLVPGIQPSPGAGATGKMGPGDKHRDDYRNFLLQLTLFGVAVALTLENLLHDLGLELAVGTLGHLDEIEVLHRKAIGVEL